MFGQCLLVQASLYVKISLKNVLSKYPNYFLTVTCDVTYNNVYNMSAQCISISLI